MYCSGWLWSHNATKRQVGFYRKTSNKLEPFKIMEDLMGFNQQKMVIYLSIYPSIHPSIYPSIHPSIHPSIYIYIYTYTYLYIKKYYVGDILKHTHIYSVPKKDRTATTLKTAVEFLLFTRFLSSVPIVLFPQFI